MTPPSSRSRQLASESKSKSCEAAQNKARNNIIRLSSATAGHGRSVSRKRWHERHTTKINARDHAAELLIWRRLESTKRNVGRKNLGGLGMMLDEEAGQTRCDLALWAAKISRGKSSPPAASRNSRHSRFKATQCMPRSLTSIARPGDDCSVRCGKRRLMAMAASMLATASHVRELIAVGQQV